MKQYIKDNLTPLLMGFSSGVIVINLINMIDSVITKIAIIIYQ